MGDGSACPCRAEIRAFGANLAKKGWSWLRPFMPGPAFSWYFFVFFTIFGEFFLIVFDFFTIFNQIYQKLAIRLGSIFLTVSRIREKEAKTDVFSRFLAQFLLLFGANSSCLWDLGRGSKDRKVLGFRFWVEFASVSGAPGLPSVGLNLCAGLECSSSSSLGARI